MIICVLKRILHKKKSRNGDTLGPVELNVWPEHPNQGERHEQDDQDDVSIIIFGMSKSSGFQKYSICWVFWHFVCVFVFVVVFVIVFVFVFVSSYDFWIAFIMSFQNMYVYRGLWSLQILFFGAYISEPALIQACRSV